MRHHLASAFPLRCVAPPLPNPNLHAQIAPNQIRNFSGDKPRHPAYRLTPYSTYPRAFHAEARVKISAPPPRKPLQSQHPSKWRHETEAQFEAPVSDRRQSTRLQREHWMAQPAHRLAWRQGDFPVHIRLQNFRRRPWSLVATFIVGETRTFSGIHAEMPTAWKLVRVSRREFDARAKKRPDWGSDHAGTVNRDSRAVDGRERGGWREP